MPSSKPYLLASFVTFSATLALYSSIFILFSLVILFSGLASKASSFLCVKPTSKISTPLATKSVEPIWEGEVKPLKNLSALLLPKTLITSSKAFLPLTIWSLLLKSPIRFSKSNIALALFDSNSVVDCVCSLK